MQSPANPDCKPSGGWPCFSNSCYRVCPSFCAETCDGGCTAPDSSCVERLAIKDIGSNYDNVWTEPASVCVAP